MSLRACVEDEGVRSTCREQKDSQGLARYRIAAADWSLGTGKGLTSLRMSHGTGNGWPDGCCRDWQARTAGMSRWCGEVDGRFENASGGWARRTASEWVHPTGLVAIEGIVSTGACRDENARPGMTRLVARAFDDAGSTDEARHERLSGNEAACRAECCCRRPDGVVAMASARVVNTGVVALRGRDRLGSRHERSTRTVEEQVDESRAQDFVATGSSRTRGAAREEIHRRGCTRLVARAGLDSRSVDLR